MTQTKPQNAFTFGRNWQNFLKGYNSERQQIAKKALLDFLKLEDLKGKSFLDIGSGSGIHSAAAWLSGASRVQSFDYDPDSVAATKQLHLHFGSPLNWTIERGSILDADYIEKLGTFDIVYSWGVLHHTGNQWLGLKNAIKAMHEKSRLYIALYAKEACPDWRYWIDVKQRYNRASNFQKHLMDLEYLWNDYLGRDPLKLLSLFNTTDTKRARGMDLMIDIRDWLGGWPTEFSSIQEVVRFMEQYDLTIVNTRFGEANSEFLAVHKNQVKVFDYTSENLMECPNNLKLLDANTLPKTPVWIFGTRRDGDLVFKYLTTKEIPVSGFIDISPEAKTFNGLPVISAQTFIKEQPPSVPIILANRYLKENGLLLLRAGFENIYNGHDLVICINKHGIENIKKVYEDPAP